MIDWLGRRRASDIILLVATGLLTGAALVEAVRQAAESAVKAVSEQSQPARQRSAGQFILLYGASVVAFTGAMTTFIATRVNANQIGYTSHKVAQTRGLTNVHRNPRDIIRA